MNTKLGVSKCSYCGSSIPSDAVWCHLCGRKVAAPRPEAELTEPLAGRPVRVDENIPPPDAHPEEEMLVDLLTRTPSKNPVFALYAESPQRKHRPWWVNLFSFRRRAAKPWYIKVRDIVLLVAASILFARMVFLYLSR